MRSKVTLNLANSGKNTSLPSCDRLSSASKAPHMTGLCARPLSRVPEYSCCAKLTTLLWHALMKTSPNIYVIRLVKPYNYHLKIHPHSKYLGLIKDFNGLDVAQHSDAIKLSCEKCINRVLTTHGWLKPSPPVPSKPSAPLPVDAVTSLYAHEGPPENTAEHAALAAKYGFDYRTLLGELLYAYVKCRPDIRYATITLSKFSTCLHDHHFAMLKKVAKYLRATKDWGIIYRRSQPDTSLPPSNFTRSTMDAELIFPLWTPRNPLHFLMPHMPMICVTANLLPAMPSFYGVAPSPTDARRSLSPLPAPPKRSSLPPLPPRSMLDTWEQS